MPTTGSRVRTPADIQVLIMSEESCLGRERIQTDYALRPALRMTPSSKGNPGRLITRPPNW